MNPAWFVLYAGLGALFSGAGWIARYDVRPYPVASGVMDFVLWPVMLTLDVFVAITKAAIK